jgi:hypothetical protein
MVVLKNMDKIWTSPAKSLSFTSKNWALANKYRLPKDVIDKKARSIPGTMNFGGIQNFIHQKLVWPPKHQEDLIKISFTVGFGTSQRFASIFATVPFLSYVCFQGSGVMPLTGQEVCVYSAPQSLAESVVSDCAAALEIGHLWNFRLPIVIQHLDLGHIPMFTGKKDAW